MVNKIEIKGGKAGDPVFLAELPEADAPPDIRGIYEEIRHLTGVPMVALIWRHLATLPGVLPDAWSSLAPVLRSGVLQETAWQLARAVRAPALPALSAADFHGMNVDPAGQDLIRTVIDAYNRANPVNMLCVYVMLARLVRPDGQALAPDVVLWNPPVSIPKLPRMYAPADMPAVTRQELENLSGFGGSGGQSENISTIPSLYRHLVPWRGYVRWMELALRPGIEDGRLTKAVGVIRAGMAREADALVVHVPPALALQACPKVRQALTQFSTLIPEMIVVGRLLRDALPDAPD